MIRKIIAALFGPCAAYGHRWINIPPTPEEAALDKLGYQAWFEEYPLGEYPKLHGITKCSRCPKVKAPSNAGRPRGYHPGWG